MMMKRIAMISEHASPLGALGGVDSGGQNVYVAQIARHLARLGFSVDVFTRRDDPHQPEIVALGPEARVIHVTAGPPKVIPKEDLLPYMQPFAEGMEAFIGKHGGYDLVHANFWMSGLVADQLKSRLHIPFVITFHALGRVRRLHQGVADRFPTERMAIEEQLMRDADRIIAECPQDRDDQIRLYGADVRKIRMVPCGFDSDEFWPIPQAEARRRLGFDPNETLVMHIGRMVRRKGVDNTIRGFAEMVRKHGIAGRLAIVGGESDEPDPAITPELGYLRQIAEESGVDDRVLFTGRRGRNVLRDYYSAADVFVTTPWYEPFGITPVEAMACGVPVIGSNVGGIKYTVMDEGTGFLVPPNDAIALGEKLARICGDQGLRRRQSALAIRRVNALFTWNRVASSIGDVYEEVLAEQPAMDAMPRRELAVRQS